MTELDFFAAWVGGVLMSASRRLRGADAEQGDVPGWVMVTVMTAGLVVAIFGVFKGQITSVVSQAITSVTSTTGS